MSSFSLDDLKKQLAHTQAEFEQAHATLYRCHGAIQVLQHLISSAESESTSDDAPIDVEAIKVD